MPRLDRTGLLGLGSFTGRGMGICFAGLGYGGGRGGGLGWRAALGICPYAPQLTRDEEAELLGDEAQMLEEELTAVKQRIAKLKAKKQL